MKVWPRDLMDGSKVRALRRDQYVVSLGMSRLEDGRARDVG